MKRFLAPFVFISIVAGTARADCPESTINGVNSTLSANDLQAIYGGSALRGTYDLVGATLSGNVTGLGSGQTEVTARDVYKVIGVPAGQPVDVTAELVVSGDAYSGSHTPHFKWDITSGADYGEGFPPGPTFANRVLQVTIHAMGEQEFPLAWHVLSGMSLEGGYAEISAQFRFSNLPAGASVVSCQGYATGAVPTTPSTWGALKASYR
jgi:hypothetical protein